MLNRLACPKLVEGKHDTLPPFDKLRVTPKSFKKGNSTWPNGIFI